MSIPDDLRAVADFLDKHPAVPRPSVVTTASIGFGKKPVQRAAAIDLLEAGAVNQVGSNRAERRLLLQFGDLGFCCYLPTEILGVEANIEPAFTAYTLEELWAGGRDDTRQVDVAIERINREDEFDGGF